MRYLIAAARYAKAVICFSLVLIMTGAFAGLVLLLGAASSLPALAFICWALAGLIVMSGGATGAVMAWEIATND